MVTKKQQLIDASNQIMKEIGMKMTVRQVYYQLVSKGIIENKKNEYKGLDAILSEARKKGTIDYESFEDKTRSYNMIIDMEFDDVSEELESMIDYIKGKDLEYGNSVGQDRLHIIGLEKQALESFFESSIDKTNIIICVNRGFNSLTQLYNMAQKIKRMVGIKEIHMSYFGDHDPSGKDIERNMRKQLEGLGVTFTSWTKIGITPEHIRKYNLPTALPKDKDSRTAKWKEDNMGDCVELDAVPPLELKKLVKETSKKYFDYEVYQKSRQEQKEKNEQFRKLFFERLQREFS